MRLSKTAVVLLWLFLMPVFMAAEERSWPCGLEKELLRRGGKVVWLSPAEVEKQATQRVAPKLPPTLRVAGEIIADIVIGTDGHVKCARVLKGHPILKAAVLEAARQWEFTPYQAASIPQTVCGHLVFRLRQ